MDKTNEKLTKKIRHNCVIAVKVVDHYNPEKNGIFKWYVNSCGDCYPSKAQVRYAERQIGMISGSCLDVYRVDNGEKLYIVDHVC